LAPLALSKLYPLLKVTRAQGLLHTPQNVWKIRLASDAGVFFTTIIRYENLQVPLTLQACACIAPVLGIQKEILYDDYLSFISGQFWDKIKEIRRDLGHSHRKMAELLGVWPKTIREWEKGNSIPTRTNYNAIMACRGS
jgi:Predicted transcriptional regulator